MVIKLRTKKSTYRIIESIIVSMFIWNYFSLATKLNEQYAKLNKPLAAINDNYGESTLGCISALGKAMVERYVMLKRYRLNTNATLLWLVVGRILKAVLPTTLAIAQLFSNIVYFSIVPKYYSPFSFDSYLDLHARSCPSDAAVIFKDLIALIWSIPISSVLQIMYQLPNRPPTNIKDFIRYYYLYIASKMVSQISTFIRNTYTLINSAFNIRHILQSLNDVIHKAFNYQSTLSLIYSTIFNLFTSLSINLTQLSLHGYSTFMSIALTIFSTLTGIHVSNIQDIFTVYFTLVQVLAVKFSPMIEKIKATLFSTSVNTVSKTPPTVMRVGSTIFTRLSRIAKSANSGQSIETWVLTTLILFNLSNIMTLMLYVIHGYNRLGLIGIATDRLAEQFIQLVTTKGMPTSSTNKHSTSLSKQIDKNQLTDKQKTVLRLVFRYLSNLNTFKRQNAVLIPTILKAVRMGTSRGPQLSSTNTVMPNYNTLEQWGHGIELISILEMSGENRLDIEHVLEDMVVWSGYGLDSALDPNHPGISQIIDDILATLELDIGFKSQNGDTLTGTQLDSIETNKYRTSPQTRALLPLFTFNRRGFLSAVGDMYCDTSTVTYGTALGLSIKQDMYVRTNPVRKQKSVQGSLPGYFPYLNTFRHGVGKVAADEDAEGGRQAHVADSLCDKFEDATRGRGQFSLKSFTNKDNNLSVADKRDIGRFGPTELQYLYYVMLYASKTGKLDAMSSNAPEVLANAFSSFSRLGYNVVDNAIHLAAKNTVVNLAKFKPQTIGAPDYVRHCVIGYREYMAYATGNAIWQYTNVIASRDREKVRSNPYCVDSELGLDPSKQKHVENVMKQLGGQYGSGPTGIKYSAYNVPAIPLYALATISRLKSIGRVAEMQKLIVYFLSIPTHKFDNPVYALNHIMHSAYIVNYLHKWGRPHLIGAPFNNNLSMLQVSPIYRDIFSYLTVPFLHTAKTDVLTDAINVAVQPSATTSVGNVRNWNVDIERNVGFGLKLNLQTAIKASLTTANWTQFMNSSTGDRNTGIRYSTAGIHVNLGQEYVRDGQFTNTPANLPFADGSLPASMQDPIWYISEIIHARVNCLPPQTLTLLYDSYIQHRSILDKHICSDIPLTNIFSGIKRKIDNLWHTASGVFARRLYGGRVFNYLEAAFIGVPQSLILPSHPSILRIALQLSIQSILTYGALDKINVTTVCSPSDLASIHTPVIRGLSNFMPIPGSNIHTSTQRSTSVSSYVGDSSVSGRFGPSHDFEQQGLSENELNKLIQSSLLGTRGYAIDSPPSGLMHAIIANYLLGRHHEVFLDDLMRKIADENTNECVSSSVKFEDYTRAQELSTLLREWEVLHIKCISNAMLALGYFVAFMIRTRGSKTLSTGLYILSWCHDLAYGCSVPVIQLVLNAGYQLVLYLFESQPKLDVSYYLIPMIQHIQLLIFDILLCRYYTHLLVKINTTVTNNIKAKYATTGNKITINSIQGKQCFIDGLNTVCNSLQVVLIRLLNEPFSNSLAPIVFNGLNLAISSTGILAGVATTGVTTTGMASGISYFLPLLTGAGILTRVASYFTHMFVGSLVLYLGKHILKLILGVLYSYSGVNFATGGPNASAIPDTTLSALIKVALYLFKKITGSMSFVFIQMLKPLNGLPLVQSIITKLQSLDLDTFIDSMGVIIKKQMDKTLAFTYFYFGEPVQAVFGLITEIIRLLAKRIKEDLKMSPIYFVVFHLFIKQAYNLNERSGKTRVYSLIKTLFSPVTTLVHTFYSTILNLSNRQREQIHTKVNTQKYVFDESRMYNYRFNIVYTTRAQIDMLGAYTKPQSTKAITNADLKIQKLLNSPNDYTLIHSQLGGVHFEHIIRSVLSKLKDDKEREIFCGVFIKGILSDSDYAISYKSLVLDMFRQYITLKKSNEQSKKVKELDLDLEQKDNKKRLSRYMNLHAQRDVDALMKLVHDCIGQRNATLLFGPSNSKQFTKLLAALFGQILMNYPAGTKFYPEYNGNSVAMGKKLYSIIPIPLQTSENLTTLISTPLNPNNVILLVGSKTVDYAPSYLYNLSTTVYMLETGCYPKNSINMDYYVFLQNSTQVQSYQKANVVENSSYVNLANELYLNRLDANFAIFKFLVEVWVRAIKNNLEDLLDLKQHFEDFSVYHMDVAKNSILLTELYQQIDEKIDSVIENVNKQVQVLTKLPELNGVEFVNSIVRLQQYMYDQFLQLDKVVEKYHSAIMKHELFYLVKDSGLASPIYVYAWWYLMLDDNLSVYLWPIIINHLTGYELNEQIMFGPLIHHATIFQQSQQIYCLRFSNKQVEDVYEYESNILSMSGQIIDHNMLENMYNKYTEDLYSTMYILI